MKSSVTFNFIRNYYPLIYLYIFIQYTLKQTTFPAVFARKKHAKSSTYNSYLVELNNTKVFDLAIENPHTQYLLVGMPGTLIC